MTATQHGIIRIETAARDGSTVTVRTRCACGKWRQAGSFPEYPGLAGAILLTIGRVDCEPASWTTTASSGRSRPTPARWSRRQACLSARALSCARRQHGS